ncbi:MAG: flagellin FliC [Nitrospirae bacterium YQR-1]
MAFVINTNIMSINAQRNLNRTQGPLQDAMQRLSSGLRINSAKDDAAGLAIATRMTAQIRGLTVAVRNANDGLSITQTAEGALDEVTNNLQRIRELGLQALSGQYGSTDVGYMQKEVNSLVEEIGRISEQTKFNGKRLLSDSFSVSMKVSYSASDSAISMNVPSVNTDVLGGNTYTSSGKDGTIMYLKDIHTATSTAVEGVGDASWVSGAGYPSAFSYTASVSITYTGRASFMVNDVSQSTGLRSAASNAIAIVDSAITSVTSLRASMGAKSNQFEAAIRNLDNVLEASQSSRSRIMDADFAQETANLTKSMILRQAGISVLSQANTAPQSVLNLLR